jgi:glycosyltransferase involved in cell wall biosynthesis
MDDVPAGPTSPGPRRPSLAVVIPVRNGGRDFECCLRRLRASTWTDFEVIVVDDGSTDGSAALAESFAARVVRHEAPRGPAAARNAGAKAASAPWIFFLDADVAVHPETLARAMTRFAADAGLAALFGSYDDRPTAPGLVSQFRNLLHHFVHQQGDFVADVRPVSTFWTGCGTIRRQVFLDLGGFDPHLYRRPAIEDIELGYRVTRAGYRIVLARDVQATHLKRWTLFEMVKTDIVRRGVPWMLLRKRFGISESDLNVRSGQKLCVAVAGLASLAVLGAPGLPGLLSIVPLCVAILVSVNLSFYRFLARRRGLWFALAAVPLHYVYYCCCGLSVLIALVIWHHSSGRDAVDEPHGSTGAHRRIDRGGEGGTTVPRREPARTRRTPRWTRP